MMQYWTLKSELAESELLRRQKVSEEWNVILTFVVFN